jgi:hypothetical protein
LADGPLPGRLDLFRIDEPEAMPAAEFHTMDKMQLLSAVTTAWTDEHGPPLDDWVSNPGDLDSLFYPFFPIGELEAERDLVAYGSADAIEAGLIAADALALTDEVARNPLTG